MKTSHNEFPSVPVNPRLKFGDPLIEVCENATLHPGLRELFLKAYLNAAGDDFTKHQVLKENHVVHTLSTGPDGQGSLEDRLQLKERVESGAYIISFRTPPGAPLWLLRHFLGRLPEPLLCECALSEKKRITHKINTWKQLTEECRNAIKMTVTGAFSLRRLKFLIGTAVAHLPKENFLVLSALMGLIRNLAVGHVSKMRLNKKATFTLTCFFTQALLNRPFRPGFATVEDRRYYPLILFLIYYWPDIRHLVTKINARTSQADWHPRISNSLPAFQKKHSSDQEGHGQKRTHKKSRSLDLSGPDIKLFHQPHQFQEYNAKYDEADQVVPSLTRHTSNETVYSNRKDDADVKEEIEPKMLCKNCTCTNCTQNPANLNEEFCAENTFPLTYTCNNCKSINTITTKVTVHTVKNESLRSFTYKTQPENNLYHVNSKGDDPLTHSEVNDIETSSAGQKTFPRLNNKIWFPNTNPILPVKPFDQLEQPMYNYEKPFTYGWVLPNERNDKLKNTSDYFNTNNLRFSNKANSDHQDSSSCKTNSDLSSFSKCVRLIAPKSGIIFGKNTIRIPSTVDELTGEGNTAQLSSGGSERSVRKRSILRISSRSKESVKENSRPRTPSNVRQSKSELSILSQRSKSQESLKDCRIPLLPSKSEHSNTNLSQKSTKSRELVKSNKDCNEEVLVTKKSSKDSIREMSLNNVGTKVDTEITKIGWKDPKTNLSFEDNDVMTNLTKYPSLDLEENESLKTGSNVRLNASPVEHTEMNGVSRQDSKGEDCRTSTRVNRRWSFKKFRNRLNIFSRKKTARIIEKEDSMNDSRVKYTKISNYLYK